MLAAGTGATILRAGLVELPDEIDEECAAGRIVSRQFTDTVDGGTGLVGVEKVSATHIEGQLSQTTEIEVALHAEREVETLLCDAEVVVVALRCPLGISRQPKTVRQFDVVVPDERDVWVVEGLDGAVSRRCLIILEDGERIPHGVPTANSGACRETQLELVVVVGTVDGTDEADERIGAVREWLGGHGHAVLHATILDGQVCPLIGRIQHEAVVVGRLQIGVTALIGIAVDVHR